MSLEHIWAPWLRDDRISFRPPVREDASTGYTWHEGDPPPLPHRIETELEASETVPWGQANTVRMIVGDHETGVTLGGVLLHRSWNAVDDIVITPSRALASQAREDIEHRVLWLLTPWLLDDVGVRSIVMQVDGTRGAVISAAIALGYEHTLTYREFHFRDGRFVDVLGFQLLNPRWALTFAGGGADV